MRLGPGETGYIINRQTKRIVPLQISEVLLISELNGLVLVGAGRSAALYLPRGSQEQVDPKIRANAYALMTGEPSTLVEMATAMLLGKRLYLMEHPDDEVGLPILNQWQAKGIVVDRDSAIKSAVAAMERYRELQRQGRLPTPEIPSIWLGQSIN